jgi:hypothetical protein
MIATLGVYASPNNYIHNREDHCSQITIADMIIMKKAELLRNLPKCDTKPQSEHKLLEK